MRHSLFFIFVICAAFCAGHALADPQSEATELKNEALKILKATADRDSAPEELAKCIYNLEKAASILEAAKDTDSDLAKDVNSQLYWARKRSTLAIDAALDKMKGNAPSKVVAVKKPDPVKPVAPVAKDPADEPDPFAGMDAARKAYAEAEKFAQAHGDDDYIVSLQWFHMASLHPGTDYSLKALSMAREAQERFKSKNPNAVKEELPDTAEMKPVREGDAFYTAKQYDKAIPLYLASITIKESLVAHRKLGQAYYSKAQQVKEEVIAKCESTYAAYKSARDAATVVRRSLGGGMRRVTNTNDPAYQAALRNYQAAFKEGDVAFSLFDKAQSEFKAVLRMAPKGVDLVSAGLIGICLSQKPDPTLRTRARSHLSQFLKEYKPVNDDERTIYEYCKTELERLSK